LRLWGGALIAATARNFRDVAARRRLARDGELVEATVDVLDRSTEIVRFEISGCAMSGRNAYRGVRVGVAGPCRVLVVPSERRYAGFVITPSRAVPFRIAPHEIPRASARER
jgi:hypothetical protein